MSELRQRDPRYKNRKLLDIAHEAPCMLLLNASGCGSNASVPCHSDLLRHGRGTGNKTHDHLAVAGCPACHAVFTREHLGRVGYEYAWLAAYERYQAWLWNNDKIQVVR